MRTRIKNNLWILLILTISFVLRFYQLQVNPPHLTPDEAALGYNAYSILKTARDEYGEFLPIIFKSFGDYKPGLYVYASIIPISIFGLTEFAVRFASAFAGVVAVWFVYMTVGRLAGLGDLEELGNKKTLPLVSASLLAISPWHIHFSRGAWEVNLALTLTLAGIFFFLKSLEKNTYLIVSSLFFGLSLLAYQGAKMSSMVVFLILGVLFWKQLVSFNKKALFGSLIVGTILTIPIILSFSSGQTGRLKVFSVFSYQRPEEYLEEQLGLAQVDFESSKYYLFYSESLNMARGIAGRWFNHFSARFLFFEGDWQNPRHSSPHSGEMLLADSVFLILGLFVLFRFWHLSYAKFVLLWLILSPLPSALSRDQIHAVRALNMVIPLAMTTALGLLWSIEKLKSLPKIATKLSYLVIILLYVASIVYFLDSYFVHQPKHNSRYWGYGYKQIVQEVLSIESDYEKIVVDESFMQPYIYFLFFQKYDPIKYQREARLTKSLYGDVGMVKHAAGIDFLPINWNINRGDSGTIFVADPIRIPPQDSSDPEEFELISEIKYLDGKETAFRIIKVKERNEEN